MSKLSVQNISKSFDGKSVLTSVNFNLKNGEIIAFLGNSGCGKSTLLRIIAGFETADSGNIVMNQSDIVNKPSHKRNIGMFFQNYALFPHLNVEDNIAYGLNSDHKTRVKELIKICKLQGEEKKLIHQISGGQQQRVALARALAPKPEILLLDEPFSNIDAVLKDQLREELKTMIKSSGVSAIFVSHDIDDAFTIADRAIILHNGTIQQFDTPENLYRFPDNTFVAQFMGDVDLMEGHIASNAFITQQGFNFPLRQSYSNSESKLYAIRQEDYNLIENNQGIFEVTKIEFKRSYKIVTLKSGDFYIKTHVSKNSTIDKNIRFNIEITQLQPITS